MPIVATKRGRLVVLAPADWRRPAELDRALGEIAGGDAWVAVDGPVAPGLSGIPSSFAAAAWSLSVAERLGIHGRRLEAGELLLERAMLADEPLLRNAVDEELGPILRAPRNGHLLLVTLEAYLASGQNVRATARVLGVAPRTVTYRLSRIEGLLGRRLDPPLRLRLGAAIFARRLFHQDPALEPELSGAAGRSPSGRRGRSRRHRSSGTAR
jgi:hypothetical protein